MVHPLYARKNRALALRGENLFSHFMAPLVLGGELQPGRILGARAALAIGVEQSVSDVDKFAHVQLGRVRIARKIVPIDRIAPPSADEWTLTACLHDIVQSTHPALAGLFRNNASRRVLALVGLALDRTRAPKNVAEALSRHTIFSRALEIGRTDTRVAWWVGSETFRGLDPPRRLTAWPDLRRVHVEQSLHRLAELPSDVDAPQFYDTLRRWISMSPLTDLATANRDAPRFAWTEPTLALVSSDVGRTLAARAVRFGNLRSALDAIERATAELEPHRPDVGKIARALVSEIAFFQNAAAGHNLPQNEA